MQSWQNLLLILKNHCSVRCLRNFSGISNAITRRDFMGVDLKALDAIRRHSEAMGSTNCFVVLFIDSLTATLVQWLRFDL